MRSILVLLVLAAASGFASAAELRDPDAAVALSEQIVSKASSGDLRAGFELARPYVVIPQSEFDAMLGQLELQLPVISARFGKSIGHELLRNDTVGGSLIQTIYIHKFEKHAMVWRFVFYKNDKGWVLNSFKYADDLTSVL